MFLHPIMSDRDVIRAARVSTSHIILMMAERLETRLTQIDRVRDRVRPEPDSPLKRDILQALVD